MMYVKTCLMFTTHDTGAAFVLQWIRFGVALIVEVGFGVTVVPSVSWMVTVASLVPVSFPSLPQHWLVI